ncbi:DUF4258 domain-containing protein (plasmid) [Alicyclobacillus sp. ALC3]|nr:DUF4258 domain-containing protein [Alicyclobacillus sp. ALC3]
MKIVYDRHAVKRIIQRRIPLDVIEQIAQVGVAVQEDKRHVMKRGDWNGNPVHVVMEKPTTVKSVYVADEWKSTISVRRNRHVDAAGM